MGMEGAVDPLHPAEAAVFRGPTLSVFLTHISTYMPTHHLSPFLVPAQHSDTLPHKISLPVSRLAVKTHPTTLYVHLDTPSFILFNKPGLSAVCMTDLKGEGLNE